MKSVYEVTAQEWSDWAKSVGLKVTKVQTAKDGEPRCESIGPYSLRCRYIADHPEDWSHAAIMFFWE